MMGGDERKRVFALFVFFSLWIVGVMAALVKTQVFDYKEHIANIKKQSNRIKPLFPKRGTIYDRQGEILAISVEAKSAFLDNLDRKESGEIFRLIQGTITLHPDKTRDDQKKKEIKEKIASGTRFIWIKRKLTDKEYEEICKVKIDKQFKSGLHFVDEYKRLYPHQSTAAHILGGVGIDEQGLAGIEYGLDSVLKGKGGRVEVLIDARNRKFEQQYLEKPVFGRDVYLTIDLGIQFCVERELESTVQKFKAAGGAAIVLDSKTGEIIAMASYPDYQPDCFVDVLPAVRKNRAVSFLYHPGSTFKVVLGALALDFGACTPQQVFNCYNGVYHIMDQTITDEHPADRLTFEDILIYSSNIGAARIGARLGSRKLYEGIKKFGFGDKADIYLTGEESGIVRPLEDWSGVSAAFLSYGYEILVTPLQMARAFNIIASGGFLVEPFVVKGIFGIHPSETRKERIISLSTRQYLTNIMIRVVELGTGKKAGIEGVEIAGKTGTTKKIKIAGRGESGYVSSFGGFFPAHDPKLTMFMVIDGPADEFYGGDVAAPLFKSIADHLLVRLGIFPELDKNNEIHL